MEKPLFVRLEEAVAQACQQVRGTADDMCDSGNALHAIPALELGKRELLLAFDRVATKFPPAQHRELTSLRERLAMAFDRQITATQEVEERWGTSLDAIWSLDQVHPNLIVALKEFRGKLM